MRQPTHDFHLDPFKTFASTLVATPEMTSQLQSHISMYAKNSLATKSHKFCTVSCVDLGQSSFQQEEVNCMSQCISKYSTAF